MYRDMQKEIPFAEDKENVHREETRQIRTSTKHSVSKSGKNRGSFEAII